MAVELAKFIDGIYSWLTADSTFNTAIGGGATTAGRLRYQLAQRDETMPYCVYTLIDGVPQDTFPKDGVEIRVQFSIYTAKSGGSRAAAVVGDKLRARLKDVHLTVTSHGTWGAEEAAARGPLLDDDAWRIDLDFLISGLVS